MKIKNERTFQQWIRDSLKKCDCEVLNVHGHDMQASGWPDLYFVHGILSGWLELKYKSGKLTPLQEHRLGRLRLKGVMAVTLRIDEEGWIIIDELADLVSVHYQDIGPREFVNWLADSWQKLRLIELRRMQDAAEE